MPSTDSPTDIPFPPDIRRILAPNPGFMTGSGTNSYLIGASQVTVLDPGPLNHIHVQAILNAVEQGGGQIHQIVLTHTHQDHSPAAKALHELTQAAVYAYPIPENDAAQDRATPIAAWLKDRQWLDTERGTLEVIHTPGHVGNHCCFWLESEKCLFSGDHLINGSTVVIIPPSGHMGSYMQSLEKLLTLPIETIYPGHGDAIHNPLELIQFTLAHRQAREQKIANLLRERGPTTLNRLTPLAYDDVNPALHFVAQFSLLAHLIHLQEQTYAMNEGELWIAT